MDQSVSNILVDTVVKLSLRPESDPGRDTSPDVVRKIIYLRTFISQLLLYLSYKLFPRVYEFSSGEMPEL